ncbi:MAG: alanine--tRNA ligase [Methanomicrobia archaeon]|nr:alanine--tRNA ligase [Methanomicrobia archaeon]
MDTKELKELFRKKASEDYENFFAVKTLRGHGFQRNVCKKCGKYFWSLEKKEICGDVSCQGKYRFIEEEPYVKLDYIEVWKKFSSLFEKLGYTSIPRYPVVARWRDDVDFVNASIYDFQPHVVSGEVEPPANPLVVPQFSLRFNDIDNVGITGSHYTGFVMIGQHAFESPENYDQEKYFEDIYIWLTKSLKIPGEELYFHEDGWAGGGNGGCCMEYFSKGLELGNQVYMVYEITPSGFNPLKTKVLDMGAGQERFAWYCNPANTSYEAVFPDVCDYLYKKTGYRPDQRILRFLPYAGLLNLDEVKNIEQIWIKIGNMIGLDPQELEDIILSLSRIYSIADHTRTLLFALSDGALPSNVGGGYNLRVIFRRISDFIEKNSWDLEMSKIIEKHVHSLKKEFPELTTNLEDVLEILEVENKKYKNMREKSGKIIENILKKEKKISFEKIIELYDSHGISPDSLRERASEKGIEITIPSNFYSELALKHEKIFEEREREEILDYPKTELLFYKDWKMKKFKAKIIGIKDNWVILDKTCFYPESGGQANDLGWIDGKRVLDVKKRGRVVLHNVEGTYNIGQEITGEIDWERRLHLTRHHTAAHIINGAARRILGNHVWQAGAEKKEERARLDITHYEGLSRETLNKIEKLANDIVLEDRKVEKGFMKRSEAEKKYGFRLYQGGAVPGKEIRVVNIADFDVEACGGIHCDSTSEVGFIKILKSEKIQDDVVRLEFAAGLKALKYIQKAEEIIGDVGTIFRVKREDIKKTAKRFFEEWKERGKEIERLKEELSRSKVYRLKNEFMEKEGLRFLEKKIEGDIELLRKTALSLKEDDTVIVLHNGRNLVCVCGKNAMKKGYKANEYIKKFGKGGGNEEMAQGVKK